MRHEVDLAYDYPVLGVFWSVLWLFLWVLWLILLFRVVADVLRDRDLSGAAKALWLVFLVFVPFLGVLVYVVARGGDMGRREARHLREQREAFDAYVRDTARTGGGGHADDLARLSDLKDRGVLTDEEFRRAKEKILG
jgi:hypothetical protein